MIKSDGAGLGGWATRLGDLASLPMKVCSDGDEIRRSEIHAFSPACLSESIQTNDRSVTLLFHVSA